MAVDTYTARARFILMGTGNDLNVWGALLNAQMIQLGEDSIMGWTSLITASTTLTSNNGATDQARMYGLLLGGSGGTITTPGVQKSYMVDASAATGAWTITTGSGGSIAVVEAGNTMKVTCSDGINWRLARDTNIAATAASLTNAYQAADTNTLNSARAYTDSKTLGQTTLPGSSIPGSFVWTDPGTGNAAWRLIQQSDVAGLTAALVNNQASDRTYAIAMAAAYGSAL